MKERALEMYLNSMTMKDIAAELGIPPATVRSWKQRGNWDDVAVQRNAPRLTSPPPPPPARKDGSPNPRAPFAPRNTQATLHGLFARYLPEETRSIVEQLETRSPIDILWDQILLASAALLRSQQLMHVRDQQDMTDIITTDGAQSTTHTVQFAWDKQASFLQAQAKAQSALQKMLDQYDRLCQSELATEEQRVRIEALRHKMDIAERQYALEQRKAGMGDDIEAESGIAYMPGMDLSLLDAAEPDPEGF